MFNSGIIVVSPCYVLLAEGKQGDKGAGQLLIMVSYDLLKELQMRPFFISIRGALTQLNPGIMSRQINRKEAFLASVGPWSAGIAVSAGGFTRTADMALKSGSNT